MNLGLLSIILALVLASVACAMPEHKGLPVEVAGPWSVTVGPGQVTLNGRQISLSKAVTVDIAPPEVVQVRDEEHAALPVFNPKAAPWVRGLHPNALLAQECVATGLLVPGTLKMKAAPGAGEAFVLDTDWGLDEYWTAVGRLEGGKIAPGQKVYLDYDYVPCRLDSVVVNAAGKVTVARGKPAANMAQPPRSTAARTAIARVWLYGPTEKLSDLNLYPVDPTVVGPLPGDGSADKLLPRSLAKLRNGEKVVIVAWGDSVTCGGGVGSETQLWYQNRFAEELRRRFPRADIELRTAGWGGYHSRIYMDQPRGAEKDFVRDVLEPKPDLVTIEFVNDAYLNGDALRTQYEEIMGKLTGNGSEVILIAPHLVRPDWLGAADPRFDTDPRPYVKDLKLFAKEHNVALADASALWCRLWRQGLPYITLEGNWINHPDSRGHQLFVDALMGLFPER
jgi:lysophospholipase L1-like esterase